MNKPMTKEEKKALLQGCGRETADQLLKSAVETATTKEMLENQVYVAFYTGVVLIADSLFNIIKQKNLPKEEAIKKILIDIENELLLNQELDAKGDMIPVQSPIPDDEATKQ